MFSAEETKRLFNLRRLVYSGMLAGFIMFAGSIILFIYLCQAHRLTYETKQDLTLYLYAGLSVGFAFLVAGMVMAAVFRIINKYLAK